MTMTPNALTPPSNISPACFRCHECADLEAEERAVEYRQGGDKMARFPTQHAARHDLNRL
jgi:hypothetical protein